MYLKGWILQVIQGYGRGDVLAFTGDHHLHGTLPTTAGERVVVTFFFEVLTEDAMGRCDFTPKTMDFTPKTMDLHLK